jgi:hypothetical protein
VKLTSTPLLSHINSSDLLWMMSINFPLTLRALQNNERGFPLIFTITVVELLFYDPLENIPIISNDISSLLVWGFKI